MKHFGARPAVARFHVFMNLTTTKYVNVNSATATTTSSMTTPGAFTYGRDDSVGAGVAAEATAEVSLGAVPR
jgi:hypothetical protein